MYKVYFNNRIVYLADDYKSNFEKFNGLFYKYKSKEEFEKVWEFFEVMSSGVNNLFIINDNLEKLKEEFYNFFKLIDASGGVVVNKDSKVLIIKRFGKWDLPKGKVNEGENIEEAALREVTEECGIGPLKIINKLQPTFHTYYLNNQQMLKQTHWFEMQYDGDENFKPQVEEDITEVKWVEKSELSSILDNTYKSVIDVLVDAKKLVLD